MQAFTGSANHEELINLLFLKMTLGQMVGNMGKEKRLYLYLTLYTKMKSRRAKNLNV